MSGIKDSAHSETPFTPALGRLAFTGAYDLAIRLLTREKVWRSALLDQVAPRDGERIIDVGCGTGSFALLMKQRAPGATIVGLDPDPNILDLAEAKARKAGLSIEWVQGFASDAAKSGSIFDKSVSSLVFHQVPVAAKQPGIEAMAAALVPGGELHIADYALQGSAAMRTLFRMTVQRLDGLADTQPNADGEIERILGEIAGARVTSQRRISTLTGAISLFRIAPDAIGARTTIEG